MVVASTKGLQRHADRILVIVLGHFDTSKNRLVERIVDLEEGSTASDFVPSGIALSWIKNLDA